MEGRLEQFDSEDSSSPYPSSFKNSFWKDLEAGRVNVFDNDMYSKVKSKRSSEQSRSNPDSSTSETCSPIQNVKKQRSRGSSKSRTSSMSSNKQINSNKKLTSTPKQLNSLFIMSDSDTDENSIPCVNISKNSDVDVQKQKSGLSLVIKRVPSQGQASDSSKASDTTHYSVVSRGRLVKFLLVSYAIFT